MAGPEHEPNRLDADLRGNEAHGRLARGLAGAKREGRLSGAELHIETGETLLFLVETRVCI